MRNRKEHFFPFFDSSIKALAGLKGKIVFDLGTPSLYRKELKSYKNEFVGVRFFSMGYKISRGIGSDKPHVDGDICQLPFKADSLDGIVCKEVLEHVYNPFMAVNEMFRVLKKKGKIFCSLPFIYPYHGSGNDKDFWRFSKDAIEYLFSKFEEVKIIPSGSIVFILQGFLPSFVNRILFDSFLIHLVNYLDKLFARGNSTSIWMVFAIK